LVHIKGGEFVRLFGWEVAPETIQDMIERTRHSMDRAEKLRTMQPQFVADVTLYAPERGGRNSVAYPGWGCPCMVTRTEPLVGYDAWPLLGDRPLEPGAKRRVGFVFLSEEGAEAMRQAGTFYLWEGGFIGEAKVVAKVD
jgi:hypothetical protein